MIYIFSKIADTKSILINTIRICGGQRAREVNVLINIGDIYISTTNKHHHSSAIIQFIWELSKLNK